MLATLVTNIHILFSTLAARMSSHPGYGEPVISATARTLADNVAKHYASEVFEVSALDRCADCVCVCVCPATRTTIVTIIPTLLSLSSTQNRTGKLHACRAPKCFNEDVGLMMGCSPIAEAVYFGSLTDHLQGLLLHDRTQTVHAPLLWQFMQCGGLSAYMRFFTVRVTAIRYQLVESHVAIVMVPGSRL